MNRDAIIATLIGIGIGILTTAIVLAGPQLTKLLPNIHLPKISLQLPTSNKNKVIDVTIPEEKSSLISIDSPLEESIESSDEVLLSGFTKKDALVVAMGPVDEDIITASSDGAYAVTISLIEGKNDIYVTSYSDDDTETIKRTVFYTKESLW